MQMFHGLAAYHGTRKPLQQLQAAEGCLGVEICTADRPIGPIGIMVAGEVTNVFPTDVWSRVGADGRRTAQYPDGSAAQHGVDLEDSAALERWMKANRDEYYHGDYCEGWMIPRAITAVWVKPYADKKTRLVAAIIAKRHGVRVVDVERKTRPWDVVGSYDVGGRYYDLAAQAGFYEYA